MTFGRSRTDLDDVISHALDQGHCVEIEKADEHVYEILVDKVPVQAVTHETFGYQISRPIEDEAKQKIRQLKEAFVSKHKDVIERSESSPWFVKQLKENGLYFQDILDWTDFDSVEEVRAALVKAELEEV